MSEADELERWRRRAFDGTPPAWSFNRELALEMCRAERERRVERLFGRPMPKHEQQKAQLERHMQRRYRFECGR
jgi:hypothetical protein